MPFHHAPRFLPLVFLLTLGCGDGGRSGETGAAKGAPKAARKRPPPPKQRNSPVQDPGAAAPALKERQGRPFTEMHGYVVKGTDESSFRRCGSSRVYFTQVAPRAASRFAQHYRWSASGNLDPVYVVVMGRIVDDTATIGENRYTAVIEIRDVLIDRSKETPACPSPPRGSMLGQR